MFSEKKRVFNTKSASITLLTTIICVFFSLVVFYNGECIYADVLLS